MPKFRSTADGPVVVYVNGAAPIPFEDGDAEFETDEEAVVAALEANPDVEAVSSRKARESEKPKRARR